MKTRKKKSQKRVKGNRRKGRTECEGKTKKAKKGESKEREVRGKSRQDAQRKEL